MTASRTRSWRFGLVGVALVAAGVLVNAFLATVARYVGTAEYAFFGAFWSLSLLVGFGVFLPVEQVVARAGATATDHAAVARATLRPVAVLLGAELAVIAALGPLLWIATGRNAAVLAAVLALCVVSAGQFVVRGWLVGRGATGTYAAVLFVDGALRVGFALVVGEAARPGIGAFAWALVTAIALAHLPFLVLLARAGTPVREPAAGTVPPAPVRTASLLLLVAGSLSGQLLLNALPVALAALASPAEHDAVGRFQAAFVLARVPLFFATPVQAMLVPQFATSIAAGGARAAARIMRTSAAALVGLAAVGAAVGLLAGPWLVRLVFGAAYTVGRGEMALLAVGTACYLVALVVTQLLVVEDRIRAVAGAWVAGVLVAAVVLFAVADLVRAAEWAFAVGTAVAVGVMFVVGRRPGHEFAAR